MGKTEKTKKIPTKKMKTMVEQIKMTMKQRVTTRQSDEDRYIDDKDEVEEGSEKEEKLE